MGYKRYKYYSDETFYEEDVDKEVNSYSSWSRDEIVLFMVLTYQKMKDYKKVAEREESEVKHLRGKLTDMTYIAQFLGFTLAAFVFYSFKK